TSRPTSSSMASQSSVIIGFAHRLMTQDSFQARVPRSPIAGGSQFAMRRWVESRDSPEITPGLLYHPPIVQAVRPAEFYPQTYTSNAPGGARRANDTVANHRLDSDGIRGLRDG